MEQQTLIALAVGAIGAHAVPWPVKAVWHWLHGREARVERQVSGEVARLIAEIARQAARIADLEDLIDLLRKALDKHLMRESAVANAAQFIVAIIQMVPNPTPEMVRLKDQAEALLRDARAHVAGINYERRD